MLLGLLAHAEIVCLKVRVVEAVEQEIGQIRYNGLCTLGFQKLHQMVVGSRMEFYQDLADDADARFLDVYAIGRLSKSRMISRHIFLNLPWDSIFFWVIKAITSFFHFSCSAFADPGNCLVRARAVDDSA